MSRKPTPHPRSDFKHGMKYMRNLMRLIDDAIKIDDWKEVLELSNDLSASAATLHGDAYGNYHGIRDAAFMDDYQIQQIKANRETTRPEDNA